MPTSPVPPVDAPNGAYRERAIEPRHTALLSIDMQNEDYSAAAHEKARTLGTAEARRIEYYDRMADVVIPNQVRLQRAAREAGIEVMYTIIESLTLDGRDRSLDHKISRIHNPKGSWEAQIIQEVAPVGDEIVITKTSSGVFNSTNIEYVLRNLGVKYLVIYGVITDQCVESAIRDAADRGFLVTMVDDCCAAYSTESHEASIEAMAGHYCRRRSTDDIITEFRA